MIKFTIATVCYNAAHHLRPTILSVETQDYPRVEHLLIDGASKDETLAQLHHYRSRSERSEHEVVFVSEPDSGLYDAMNKALQKATGDYIVFLNAGDRLHATDTLSRIAAQLERKEGETYLPAVIYGDTDIVDSEGKFLRRRRLSPPSQLNWRSFRQGMLICHQAFFARTDLARATPYDLDYHFSADFDWCIRILRAATAQGETFHNSHLVVVDYLSEGMTTQNHKASLRERYHIMTKHYGALSTLIQHAWFVIRAFSKK